MIFSKRLQKGRNREVECLDMVYDKVQSTGLALEIPNALLHSLVASVSYVFSHHQNYIGVRQWSTIVDKLA